MAIVHTWVERERVERAASEVGLEVVTTRPVAFREGREAHLGLYELAHRGARARESARGPLVIRDARDARSGEYSAAREWMGFPP